MASPINGLRWIEPIRAINSPAQLTVSGVDMFPKMNRKNSNEKIGMY